MRVDPPQWACATVVRAGLAASDNASFRPPDPAPAYYRLQVRAVCRLESRGFPAAPMTLSPGAYLGPYRILANLGEGGMGEVYRARDSKLDRDVAIKVLRADVAGDRERLARFSREARVLAALNHPNIAHIIGLEEAADAPALVMELVEGPTHWPIGSSRARCPSTRPSASPARSPTHSRRHTTAASSTAI